jgi:hypothetical protein
MNMQEHGRSNQQRAWTVEEIADQLPFELDGYRLNLERQSTEHYEWLAYYAEPGSYKVIHGK